ncbi:MAG: hypothetical protein MAG431_02125 [Chloroflexi bacterium]|nr:hypothetical protein [Chloroflexota bacterium]
MRKYILPTFLGIVFFLSAFPSPAMADEGDSTPSLPLCPPGVQTGLESDCYLPGPSQYLTEMAVQGYTFPPLPLPASHPDSSLNQVDYQYASVKKNSAPVFATLDDAIKHNNSKIVQRLRSGFDYVAYSDSWIAGGRIFYRTQKGWTTSEYVSAITTPTFQGLEFSKTPQRPFGWILNYFSDEQKTITKRTPGFARDDYTGHYLEHLEVVQIYETVEIDGKNWYMIGPDEWIYQTAIAKVNPKATPPEGKDINSWIEINLYEQTVAVYENRELVFATITATGTEPTWTYPGLFQIYEKLDTTGMRGGSRAENNAYYLEEVPWTMYFDDRRALHGAYWRPYLGFPQSHGCVNLSVGDARWLYEWGEVGDWVYVWDPSGETPFEE